MNIRMASLLLVAVCLNGLTAASASAHPGHETVLTEKLAILRGKAVVSSLVRKQEPVKGEILDESWIRATGNASCKETPEFYLIAFDNRAAGKTLYVLLTSAGKYLRANFDGHFADLAFSAYPVLSCS